MTAGMPVLLPMCLGTMQLTAMWLMMTVPVTVRHIRRRRPPPPCPRECVHPLLPPRSHLGGMHTAGRATTKTGQDHAFMERLLPTRPPPPFRMRVGHHNVRDRVMTMPRPMPRPMPCPRTDRCPAASLPVKPPPWSPRVCVPCLLTAPLLLRAVGLARRRRARRRQLCAPSTTPHPTPRRRHHRRFPTCLVARHCGCTKLRGVRGWG